MTKHKPKRSICNCEMAYCTYNYWWLGNFLQLRTHLTHAQKHQHQQTAINLNNPDSQAMHLETRLEQLDSAIKMELWQVWNSTWLYHNSLVFGKKLALFNCMWNTVNCILFVHILFSQYSQEYSIQLWNCLVSGRKYIRWKIFRREYVWLIHFTHKIT